VILYSKEWSITHIQNIQHETFQLNIVRAWCFIIIP